MTARSSASPRAAGSIPTTSSPISIRAASCSMCCGGSRPKREPSPDRDGELVRRAVVRGNCRLGRSAADPVRLPAGYGWEADRPVACVSMDEPGRGGRVRNQWVVASGDPFGRSQRGLDADRGGGIVAIMEEKRIVDLSHVIEHGMTTYRGLPPPHICDFWTGEASAENYDDGSSFQIGRIDMVANTGTYLDSLFHRYAEGRDLAELPLPSLADVPGIVVRQPWENDIAVDAPAFEGLDAAGRVV